MVEFAFAFRYDLFLFPGAGLPRLPEELTTAVECLRLEAWEEEEEVGLGI